MALDSKYIIYQQRAQSELSLAKAIQSISNSSTLKRNLSLHEDATFYSNVISTCYFCIFYAAKALLLSKHIITSPPEEHKKTYDAFETLVQTGTIDLSLLYIYKDSLLKADYLLGIFKMEKDKRVQFTYKQLPQSNKEPAEESLKHAETFLKQMNLLIKQSSA